MENYIVPYLKIVKNCKHEQGCFSQSTTGLNGLNPVNYDEKTNGYKLILADGSSWYFELRDKNCIANEVRCMNVYVDVNGDKKPNIMGRDHFAFQVFPFTNQVLPNFLVDGKRVNGDWIIRSKDVIDNACLASIDSGACTAKIIADGWQMNY